MKAKKILIIAGLTLDVIVTLGLAIVNVIALVQVAGKSPEELRYIDGLGGFIVNNSTMYLWLFVIPLFVLLAGNIVLLLLYVRKAKRKDPVKVTDLSDEQKEALRKELLKDLQSDNKE